LSGIALPSTPQSVELYCPIEQAIGFGNTGKKAGSYVDQILKVRDGNYRRLGSRGVRDIALGDGSRLPTVGGAATDVSRPRQAAEYGWHRGADLDRAQVVAAVTVIVEG
jgi:hypothetical protein